jgi:hypothetical protein
MPAAVTPLLGLEIEIQRRVLYVAKRQEGALTEETGIHPSLTENDMRNYFRGRMCHFNLESGIVCT